MGQPQPIGDILSQLMARRGYARQRSADACQQAWREAAGETWAGKTRATQIRRGVLEVLVSHSLLIQEINFSKADLVKRLAGLLPEENIRDLKFRVGSVD